MNPRVLKDPPAYPSPRLPNRGLVRSGAVVIALSAAVYLPIMAAMPLRSTGDEKVYIAQALEMARDGHWFVQTLADQPDYYKGPLFYVLLRVGFLLFGTTSPFAATYMNFIALTAAALAIFALVRRRLGGGAGADWLAAGLVLFSGGAFAHGLASQMEAPLIGCYAIFMALLGAEMRSGKRREWLRRLALWTTAAAAGWLKSPLHAVLLGASALMFWALRGELRHRLGDWREQCAIAVGVVLGVAGYAPAFFFDRAAFLAAYVGRETFAKPANGEGPLIAVAPLFGTHLLPWSPLVIAALIAVAVALRDLWCRDAPLSRDEAARLDVETSLASLAAAMLAPTIFFFVMHPFRSAIYTLPAMPAVALLIAVAWDRGASPRALPGAASLVMRAFSVSFTAITALVALVAILIAAVVLRFSPLPAWWGTGTTPAIFSLLGVAGLGFGAAAGRKLPPRTRTISAVVAAAALFAGLGRAMVALGDREMVDPRGLAAADDGALRARETPWLDLDLSKKIWSEWGLLNLWLGRPVAGVHSELALRSTLAAIAEHPDAVSPVVFLASDEADLAALKGFIDADPRLGSVVLPWRRWRVHGRTPGGGTVWQEAWHTGSLAPLERQEFIVLVAVPHLNHRAEIGGDAKLSSDASH